MHGDDDIKVDLGIEKRLNFLGLDASDKERLRRVAPQVMAAMGPALDGFYARMRAEPDLMRHFSGEPAMNRAKALQNTHWKKIVEGSFGPDYVAAVRRIGEIHAQIGLEPHWYIGAYGAILDCLIRNMAVGGGGPLAWMSGNRNSDAVADISAVVRAALLDMDLSISVYLDRIDAGRRRAETASRAAFEALAEALGQVADGDLTAQVAAELSEQTGFNSTIGQLREIIAAVRTASNAIAKGSDELSSAANDLARRTEQQAASLEQTAASLDQLTQAVRQTAARSEQASTRMSQARDDAAATDTIMRETRSAMDQIAASSAEVGQMLAVINDIAFQTNLLALNAGVEAARAGDAGRGFAVVASEVRQLAQRSAESARNIRSLIERSNASVDEGRHKVEAAAEALGRILGAVTQVSDIVGEIAMAARDQAVSVQEINGAIGHLDQVTQQNAAMVEETTAASSDLRSEAGALAAHVGHFRTGRGEGRRGRDAPLAEGQRRAG
jgi:methyl-accepting chemotaxis protein